MKILKDPADYAQELCAIFPTAEAALAAFNTERNTDGTWIARMPSNWCLEVARELGFDPM
jgi:hypothetical protein